MRYDKHIFTKEEYLKYIAIYCLITLLISYLFYDSIIPFFVFIPFFFSFLKRIEKSICEKQKETLKEQFCEMISSLSTAISAGTAVDNAFTECLYDMEKLYGENSLIVQEVSNICECQKINKSMEPVFSDFAERSGDEDIKDFFDIFCEARVSGGNLKEIIKKTVSVIRDKKIIEDEISAMLKGKQLEQNVMSVVPMMIIVFLKITSFEFMSSLYHNIFGYIVMSICLIIYILAFLLSEKITNIKV